jgi:hypothetical protein
VLPLYAFRQSGRQKSAIFRDIFRAKLRLFPHSQPCKILQQVTVDEDVTTAHLAQQDEGCGIIEEMGIRMEKHAGYSCGDFRYGIWPLLSFEGCPNDMKLLILPKQPRDVIGCIQADLKRKARWVRASSRA